MLDQRPAYCSGRQHQHLHVVLCHRVSRPRRPVDQIQVPRRLARYGHVQHQLTALTRSDPGLDVTRAEHECRAARIATAKQRLPRLIASWPRDAGELAHDLLRQRREQRTGREQRQPRLLRKRGIAPSETQDGAHSYSNLPRGPARPTIWGGLAPVQAGYPVRWTRRDDVARLPLRCRVVARAFTVRPPWSPSHPAGRSLLHAAAGSQQSSRLRPRTTSRRAPGRDRRLRQCWNCGGARRHRSCRWAVRRVPADPLPLGAVPKKYREVRAALREAGWEALRQRGSHEVWGKPGGSGRIVVAGKDSDTVPVGTPASIRRASGLEQLR